MTTFIDNTNATWDRFLALLELNDPNAVAYVYRTNGRGKPIKPFWFREAADQTLVDAIQLDGGGTVRIIVRRGRTIVFSACLSFAPRL